MPQPDAKLVDYIGEAIPPVAARIAELALEEMKPAIAEARAIDDSDATEAAAVCSMLMNVLAEVITKSPTIMARPSFAMGCADDIAQSAKMVVMVNVLRNKSSRVVVVGDE